MTDIRPQLRAMPSSLNDACRTMEAAAEQIDALVKAMQDADKRLDDMGYGEYVKARNILRAALSRVGGASRQGERSPPGPMVPWELKCQQEKCTAPECDCPPAMADRGGERP